LEKKIDVSVIKEKSFDPYFVLKVSYQDDQVSFKNAIVNVVRKPPKVKIEYPDEIMPMLSQVDIKKLELEIMHKIVEYLLNASRRF
jgi:hypothetical protein